MKKREIAPFFSVSPFEFGNTLRRFYASVILSIALVGTALWSQMRTVSCISIAVIGPSLGLFWESRGKS